MWPEEGWCGGDGGNGRKWVLAGGGTKVRFRGREGDKKGSGEVRRKRYRNSGESKIPEYGKTRRMKLGESVQAGRKRNGSEGK